LPGIGKKRAELIVERREKKPFASLEELSRMKGMRNLVHKLRRTSRCRATPRSGRCGLTSKADKRYSRVDS